MLLLRIGDDQAIKIKAVHGVYLQRRGYREVAVALHKDMDDAEEEVCSALSASTAKLVLQKRSFARTTWWYKFGSERNQKHLEALRKISLHTFQPLTPFSFNPRSNSLLRFPSLGPL